MAAHGVGFTVVVNPTVGDLSGTTAAARTIVQGVESTEVDPSLVRLGILLGGKSLDEVASAIAVSGLSNVPVDFIYRAPAPTTQSVENIVSRVNLGSHFASDKSIVRRYKTVLPPRYEVVKFDDRFPVRESNMEYVPLAESLFTDDHLYYEEDDYFGFGDYVTIGDNYRDGGSSPRAVVVHFTYVEPNEGTIKIRHFASDSNHDTSDTAAKFEEATGKLLAFTAQGGITNPAVPFHPYQPFRHQHSQSSSKLFSPARPRYLLRIGKHLRNTSKIWHHLGRFSVLFGPPGSFPVQMGTPSANSRHRG